MSKRKSAKLRRGFGAPPNLAKRLGRMREKAGVTTYRQTSKYRRKGWTLGKLEGLQSSYLYKKWESLDTRQEFIDWIAENFPHLHKSYRGDITSQDGSSSLQQDA